MKFSIKNYYASTPRNFRKWGDIWAVFWLSVASGAGTLLHPRLTILFIVLAATGKAFSNFFTTNQEDKP